MKTPLDSRSLRAIDPKQLRNYQRATLRVRVEYGPVKGTEKEGKKMKGAAGTRQKRHVGVTSSVGLGGVYIETKDLFKIGDELWLQFYMPGEEQVVEAVGKVSWLSNKPNPSERLGGPGMGISFNRLNERGFRLIDSYVTTKSRLFRKLKFLLSQDPPDLKKVNELLSSTYIKEYRNLQDLRRQVDLEMSTFRLSRKN